MYIYIFFVKIDLVAIYYDNINVDNRTGCAVQYTMYMFCIPAAEKYIRFDVDTIMLTTTDQSQRAV